jgi:hypothetical protein
MSITLDFLQLIGLFGGMLGFFLMILLACAKLLLNQVEKRLDERFDAQQEGRKATQAHWDAQFDSVKDAAASEAKRWGKIEREVLELKANLPITYVLRDDYIRNQSVIEAKLDGLALRIENALLKGENRA